jgi:hypothetical protein
LRVYILRVKPLRGHFDGRHVVLDEPAALEPNSQVTVLAAANGKPGVLSADSKSIEEEFEVLSKKWRDDIGPESSLSRITGNLSYLRIISLGWSVVPCILKDLQREPAPWFLALRAITGEDQIGREHAGNFKKLADVWLAWGKQHGYI